MRAYNRIELEKVARETGFIRDNLEKVIRLSNILEFLVSDDNLKGKVVLSCHRPGDSRAYAVQRIHPSSFKQEYACT